MQPYFLRRYAFASHDASGLKVRPSAVLRMWRGRDTRDRLAAKGGASPPAGKGRMGAEH